MKIKKKLMIPHFVVSMSLILLFTSSCTTKDPEWTKVQTDVKETNEFNGKLRVYMDASKSMLGFVDVYDSDFNEDLPVILSSLRNNLRQKTSEEYYYFVTNWNKDTSPTSVGWDEFKSKLTDQNAYKGTDTQLHEIISKVSEGLNKGDVAIFVTDGVLSMGNAYFKNRPGDDNSKHFGELRAGVKEALDEVFQKGLSLAIVRTTGKFKGKYYTGCDEKIVRAFEDSTMIDRPYFYVLLGEMNSLERVLSAIDVDEKNREKYQTSLYAKDSSPITYSLAKTDKDSGLYDIKYHQDHDSTDYSCMDVYVAIDYIDEEHPLELFLGLPAIETSSMVKLNDSIFSDNNRYFIIEKASKEECQKKVQASNQYWESIATCYLLKFKKGNEIRKSSSSKKECNLFVVYEKLLDNKGFSTDNDLEMSLDDIKGKTFGLSKLLDAIELSSFKDNMFYSEKNKSKYSKNATLTLNVIIK